MAIVAVLGAALAASMLARRTPHGATRHLRVVSLSPNTTEILFAIGAGGDVVGVTASCDYPPEARSVTRIGGYGCPNAEKILALRPDVVVGAGEGMGALPAVRLLVQRGIPVRLFEHESFGAILELTRRLGEATGRQENARRLVASLSARLAALDERTRNVPEAKRPRVYVEVWNDPIMSIGSHSFITELVRRAGGASVTADLPGDYPRVAPELVVERDPQVILTGYMNDPAQAAAVARRIGWGRVAAARDGRIITDIDPDLLLRPGPRLVDGAEQLFRRLYPEGAP